MEADPFELIRNWKSQQLKIVFTNGCFDLLHVGHITYLQEAKNEGDKLVVGLNSDLSVQRLKGQKRPVFSLKERSEILSALSCVDLVIPFEEDTPLELIQLIKPDILVKGGDYEIDNIVGSKFVISNGGRVKSLTFVKGSSSSEIITRIKEL